MKLLLIETNEIIDLGEHIVYAKPGGPNGGLQQCPENEATHIWNTEQDVAYMAHRDIRVVEVETIPEEVVPHLYKYEDEAFIINVEYRTEQITRKLEEKDKIINRATEDLYKATGVEPYANVANTIAEKEALRKELMSLK